jgi:hypothetical protein
VCDDLVEEVEAEIKDHTYFDLFLWYHKEKHGVASMYGWIWKALDKDEHTQVC